MDAGYKLLRDGRIHEGRTTAALVALIFSMAVKIMIPSDAIFAENASIVSIQEIANFLIAGTVAYLAWVNGIRSIKIR